MGIVLPNSVTLSAAIATEGNSPWIGIDNRVAFDNVTADSEADNYPVEHLANPATDITQRWQAADTTACQIVIDPVDTSDINYVAVARHNLGTVQATIKIEAYIVDTWTEVISERYLANDEPVLFRFDAVDTTSIRVSIGSGSADAYISVMYLGALTVVPTTIYVGHTPLRFGRQTTVVNSRNQGGQFLGRVVTGETFRTNVNLRNLAASWIRTPFFDVIESMQENPFFFAWRPTEYPDEVGYAWTPSGGDPRPVNARANGDMSVSFDIEGLI